MKSPADYLAEINPIACEEVEPTYLFERGKVRLVTESFDIAVPLEWARERFPHLVWWRESMGRFPLAVAQLGRLEDSLRAALEEAEAAGASA